MICIIKTIAAWLIILFVGTNLIGFVVRGLFWSPPSSESPTDRVQELLRTEALRTSITNGVMTFGGFIATAIFLFMLFHFWNLGLALAGAVIMVSRIPDLLWEIQIGRKLTIKDHQKGPIYFLATIFLWASLILIWFSLCKWKS